MFNVLWVSLYYDNRWSYFAFTGDSVPLGVSINPKEIQQTEKHEVCSENFPDESLNQINNSRNLLPHLKPIVNYDTCNKKTSNNSNTKDELDDSEIKPIVNGEKTIDPIMDGELKSPVNTFHTNGLRTGILQEAVLAIQDRKLKQTSEQCKSTIKCVNGVLETKRELILSTKVSVIILDLYLLY